MDKDADIRPILELLNGKLGMSVVDWNELRSRIHAYGEACRRAGAEAMRRKAAAECEDAYSGDIPTEPELQTGEIIKERIMGLPFPPASEAADLTTPYRPALINYPDSGDSEFVMFDTGCIYEEAGDYAIIKDMETRTPIGFRWRTKSPPTSPQSSPKAASPPAGWRPIDTAPTNGEHIMLYCESVGQREGQRNEEDTGWTDSENEVLPFVTHWMPLLPAPRYAPSEEARASPPNTEDARGG